MRLADGAVSRTLAPLARDLSSPLALSARRLAALLAIDTHGAVELTPYDAIGRVPPGIRASLEGKTWSTAPVARTLEPIFADVPTLAARLRKELEGAVERAMEGASRVAVFVGGGVDSSVVLALAHARARALGDVTVVPIGLDCGGPGDDRPYLRALAEHLGLAPVWVPPAAAAPFVRRAMVADAAPYAWPSGPYERALAHAAKEHGADVVLSGVEGDFVFDGDPRDLARLVREGDPLRGVREARALVMPWPVSTTARLRDWLLRPLLAPLVPQALLLPRRRKLAHQTFPFAGPVLRAFLDERIAAAASGPRSAAERWAALTTMPRFAEIAITRVQLESETGLRFREPLIDSEVLRFVAQLDPLDLMAGGRLRGLLRESVRGLVPDHVRLRSGKWAHEPAMLAAVEAAGGFETLRDLARPTRCRDLGLVDVAAFERTFDALARAPFEGDWTTTWAVLAVEAFLRGV